MVKKFQLIFQDRIEWRLLFKSVFVVLVLLGLVHFEFSFWASLFSFFIFLTIYFSLPIDRVAIKFSFWILLLLAVFGLIQSSSGAFKVFTLTSFGILFFVLLCITNFVFKDRFLIYGIWNVLFLFLLFSELFYSNLPESPKIILLFPILLIIFKESLDFFGILWKEKVILTATALSLIGVEIFWLVSFLPLGFINSGVFLALIFLIFRDIILFHFQGALNRAFIFKEVTFFVVLTIIIFASSRWVI